VKKRNSQDFPAAGLRWNVKLEKGLNSINVIARKGKDFVRDNLSFQYQTESWGKPAKLALQKVKEENGIATVEARLLDEKGIPCLDGANWIRFGLAGDGKLIDNQGTSSGSRFVQMYNGRATIRIQTNNGTNIVSAQSTGLKTVTTTL